MRVLSVLVLLEVASALKLLPDTKSGVVALPKATAESQPVFYMTAMAKLADKYQTRLWLQSLRHTGKWKGEVVMVTDKPQCLAKNLGEELLGGAKLSESDNVTVYPGGVGMGKIYMIKKPSTTNVKLMKQEKAMAWINIRQIGLNPSIIVHTDQDIVFGKDVSTILKEVNALELGYTMALFKDQGQSKGQLHTGIIFLFPGEVTDACLADWATKILKESASKYRGFSRQALDTLSEDAPELLKQEAEAMGPDQKALGATGKCKAGKGIARLTASHLMMPTSQKLNSKQTATFIHFTNTNRWKNIKPQVKQTYFTSVLGLPEIDFNGYQTCQA